MTLAERELESFVAFARSHAIDGASSLDELFDAWRRANPPPELHDANVHAINASIGDYLAGERGTPAGKHSAALRASTRRP